MASIIEAAAGRTERLSDMPGGKKGGPWIKKSVAIIDSYPHHLLLALAPTSRHITIII